MVESAAPTVLGQPAWDPHGHLADVHPDLVTKVAQIATALLALGYPIVVTAGVRTVAEQQALYAQGRTAPGAIVTNDDGVLHKSNHQPHADGFGHAVDCVFLVAGQPSWDGQQPWHLYGAMAQTLGCYWGGTWRTIVDLPHIELPDAAA